MMEVADAVRPAAGLPASCAMGRVVVDEVTRLTASEFVLRLQHAIEHRAGDPSVPVDATRLGPRVELSYPESELAPTASMVVHLRQLSAGTSVVLEVEREQSGADVPDIAERFIRRILEVGQWEPMEPC